jgi:adenosylcobinamide-GDP ribazoletransferase
VGARWPQATIATAWFAAVAVALSCAGLVSPARLAALALVLALVTSVTGLRYMRRLGGITGDFLGATEQLGELTGFAVLAWSDA